MKLPGFRWVHSMNSLIRLCLCLVLVSLVTAGAFVYTNRSYTVGMLPGVQVCQAEPLQQNDVDYTPSAIGGNEPVIQVFKADPMELDAADSAAVYTFKVKRAKNVQIDEGGTNIKNISNPSGATLQGTVKGLPAAAIPTDDSGKFITFLMASNDDGSVKAELTLSIAQKLLPLGLPAGSTDNQTEPRSPKWLDQYSTPVTSTPSTTTRNEPDFFKCPDSCAYCLKPGEAANLGYTKKCSDERCYYSPDDQQNWYCYSEPEGWCCANGKVGQSTKGECTKIGGYWSAYQSEAIEACQPKGYCCLNGQVYYPTTQAQCVQSGGSYWSTDQAQTMERCQPPTCWCCLKGQVYQTTQAQCTQSGGACYTTQSQADAGCRGQGETILQTPSYR
jgi:hypothetical protein